MSPVARALFGLAFGVQRFTGEVAELIREGFYTIPKVTLYPVVLLIFGLDMTAKVAFDVMHGPVPMPLFTLGAARNLPPVLIRTAKVLRLSPGRTMLWVLVPACLPDIVNGLRISFSLNMLGVLIAEMFSSQRGLRFLLVSAMAQHNVPLSTAVVTVIVPIAIAANTLMLRLGKRTAHRLNQLGMQEGAERATIRLRQLIVGPKSLLARAPIASLPASSIRLVFRRSFAEAGRLTRGGAPIGWLASMFGVAKPKYDDLEHLYAAIQPSSRLEAEDAAFDEPRDKNAR